MRDCDLTPEGITHFLSNLSCTAGGKHAYFRAIRAFVNWLARNDYLEDNPISKVDPPKPSRPILSSLTADQVDYLIGQASNLRDKCIISLLADSGMRLGEIANVQANDIDWESYTITVWGKGSKQRKAPFAERTADLLRQWIPNNGSGNNIWHLKERGIQTMLQGLESQTGIKCNAHSFRRGFACNLHRKGLSTLSIMHLGGWEDLSMVLRYTRSITFEDCLEHYKAVNG